MFHSVMQIVPIIMAIIMIALAGRSFPSVMIAFMSVIYMTIIWKHEPVPLVEFLSMNAFGYMACVTGFRLKNFRRPFGFSAANFNILFLMCSTISTSQAFIGNGGIEPYLVWSLFAINGVLGMISAGMSGIEFGANKAGLTKSGEIRNI